MIMLPLLDLLAQAQGPAPPPISFPINAPDFGYFSLDDLQRLEVSLVRPLGTPRGERRGNVLMVLQRFAVVDARTPVGRTVDVRLPNRDPRRTPKTIIGRKPTAIRFAAPPQGTYLLLSERPANGALPREFRPRRPDTIDDMPRVESSATERLGLALMETTLTRLPRNGSPVGDALRALARSTDKVTNPNYSALPVWNRILPFSAITWDGDDLSNAAKRDAIEGLPALEFYRTAVAPLLPSRGISKGDPSPVYSWALRTRWGVPNAAESLAKALIDAVEAGDEARLSDAESPLNDLGNAGYRERVGLPQDAMLTLASHARTSFLRDFALSYILRAPSRVEQEGLRPLLEDRGARRRLLAKLANWNGRPDLAPPSNEASYAAREESLVAFWKSELRPPTPTSGAGKQL